VLLRPGGIECVPTETPHAERLVSLKRWHPTAGSQSIDSGHASAWHDASSAGTHPSRFGQAALRIPLIPRLPEVRDWRRAGPFSILIISKSVASGLRQEARKSLSRGNQRRDFQPAALDGRHQSRRDDSRRV
jgi:hypothetical protein